MKLYVLLPLLVCIVGGIWYLVADTTPPATRRQELARIAFFCGLLVTLWELAGDVIKL
jgi:hypothetical protein